MISKKNLDKYRNKAQYIIERMSAEEKIMQLCNKAPENKAVGLKSYNWWNEALHGVARAGIATVFPQAIAMAATFDEELLEQTGDAVSTEGRAKFNEFQKHNDHGAFKGLTFWAPNINISRSPLGQRS